MTRLYFRGAKAAIVCYGKLLIEVCKCKLVIGSENRQTEMFKVIAIVVRFGFA